eukprot:NODE_36_length_31474_cov_0.342438.p10 type:complete len:318 gc:universal NODE_36_length_31474_cov_0.342438:2427-3380(+)
MCVPKLQTKVAGIEFFSGIGAWKYGMPDIDFVPFDINEKANSIYFDNHGVKPIVKNLASLKCKEIPDALIWCMSPPCQPFTLQKSSRYKKKHDFRNDALINLISMISLKLPRIIILENVANFKNSDICELFKKALNNNHYKFDEVLLCPTQLGIPNKRKRYFLIAILDREFSFVQPKSIKCKDLSEYLDEHVDKGFYIEIPILEKYFKIADIVTFCDRDSNCFTKNYNRIIEGSGSLIQTKLINLTPSERIAQVHQVGLRRFTPLEIARIFGFPSDAKWNALLNEQYKLLGNSINVNVVKFIYAQLKPIIDDLNSIK